MKKIISMLLVVALIVAMAAVGMATTSAAQTATITVYDVNGNAVTEEIEVGEEFTVYTTLDVSQSVSGGMIGSVQGTQTYSTSVLTLVDEVSGEYGEIADLTTVFPVTGTATMANASTAGKITYNASTPSKTDAFKFDSPTSKLIVTTYKVTAAGSGEVKNTIKNLAAADDELTRIVFEGKTQTGKTFSIGSSLTDPLALDHAEITVHSLDGTTETIEANIGDEFTVYTTLNVAQSTSASNGMISSINASQNYTSKVLTLADAVDEDGLIEDVETVFPILGNKAMANAGTKGVIKYSASTPSITDGFVFNDDTCQLITTTYKVKANGVANITNTINILAAATDPIVALVKNGAVQSGAVINMPASFNDPSGPTPTTLTVSVTGPDGKTTTKEVNIGESFTVYTVLDITASYAAGKATNVAGTQTYPTSKLKLTDSYDDEYGEVDDVDSMFPLLGDKAMATVQNGTITFSASVPKLADGFLFNSSKSKLIVTNYKATAAGKASVVTALTTLTAADAIPGTEIVKNGVTQPGKSFTLFSQYTDPGNPEQPTEPTQPATQPTQPATQPTQPATQPTQAPKDTTVTIYGLDGKSHTMQFNVGESFTVYSTFKTATPVASINGKQTYTANIIQATDAVDEYGVVENGAAMFPVLGANAMGRVVVTGNDGEIRYNASTPYLGAKGYDFSADDTTLMVAHYKVIAKGNAEVRDSLVTVAAADASLTRIVSKGVVADGYTIGGYASYYEPGTVIPTEPTQPAGQILLGDANGDGEVETVDATVIQRVATRVKVPYPEEVLMNGDIDGDGDLTVVDATFIQRYTTRVKTPYPIGEYITR